MNDLITFVFKIFPVLNLTIIAYTTINNEIVEAESTFNDSCHFMHTYFQHDLTNFYNLFIFISHSHSHTITHHNSIKHTDKGQRNSRHGLILWLSQFSFQ